MDKTIKNKILFFEIGSLIFCLIFSFINHYLFEWTNKSILIASFVPVNESVWEHGKLLFMPYLFFGIIEYFFIGGQKNYVFAKSVAAIISVPLMIVMFYTYTGIIGKNITIIDILLSVFIIVFINFLSYKLIICDKIFTANWIVIIVGVYYILYLIFTFYPPMIPLFLDKKAGLYGIF